MSRCERCHARIPVGRNFCHPHYLEALLEYERDMEQYQVDRQAWENLSVEERRQRDEEAEAIEVTVYTFFTALGLGGLAWYGVYRLYPIDGLIGLAIVGAVTVFSINSPLLRTPLGRLTRAFVKAVPDVLASTLLCLLLGMISNWVAAYWTDIALILGGLLVFGRLVTEMQGQRKSTGEPLVPMEPRP